MVCCHLLLISIFGQQREHGKHNNAEICFQLYWDYIQNISVPQLSYCSKWMLHVNVNEELLRVEYNYMYKMIHGMLEDIFNMGHVMQYRGLQTYALLQIRLSILKV